MEKKYESGQSEAQIRALWEREQVYYFPPESRDAAKTFTIDTPPPTVSGSLHIGHIFSYTQTDIIARHKRMSGYQVFYPFGCDDNGLATERFVEKKRDVLAFQLKRSDFIAICLEETKQVEEQFKDLWQRIGLSIDWTKWYSTIDDRSRYIAQASFCDLLKKGDVYRKEEPAPYCALCRTSVAQAELDDSEQQTLFNDIYFYTEDGEKLTIATTRPELLPACVAVFYNPKDPRYQYLAGKNVKVPIFGQTVSLLPDEQVVIDKGTGLVMCCTFGDTTDVAWFKKWNLPYRPAMGRDGRWLESTGPLAGLKAKQAREKIIELLRAENILGQQKPIQHTIGVHERCKQPIEFLALPQWFLKILPYKKEFLACADQINWSPAFMKTRYIDWVENLKWDWCLSRQRFYGIAFPVWHCTNCNEIIVAKEEQLPIDPQETPYNGACPACKSTDIVPDTDVMDTWNTSSLTPEIVRSLLEKDYRGILQKEYMPMSMRPQAHDIIRTWAFYTIIKSWLHHGQIPWREIVISGHVLSSERDKISKSQGNSPLKPENLLATYSADAIRYWTASGTLGYDTAFSEAQLKVGHRLVTKLWNAFLLIAEHTQGVPAGVPQSLEPLNGWILHRATETFERYEQMFATHEFSLALQAVEQFFWSDVCDNYFELMKDCLFNPQFYTPEQVAETKQTLATLGIRILQMYAPFVPYVTEAIYGNLYKGQYKHVSIHTTQFTDVHIPVKNQQAVDVMQAVLAVVTAMRQLKAEHALSLKVEVAELTLSASEEILAHLRWQEQLLKGITRARNIVYVQAGGEQKLEERDGVWFGTIVVKL
jgi:valyl-tRNA synthetase